LYSEAALHFQVEQNLLPLDSLVGLLPSVFSGHRNPKVPIVNNNA